MFLSSLGGAEGRGGRRADPGKALQNDWPYKRGSGWRDPGKPGSRIRAADEDFFQNGIEPGAVFLEGHPGQRG